MNDIKVGEYIRTNSLNHGFIQKAIYVDDEVVYYSEHCKISKEAITKHSPNIIDLIECGDYVNGYRVMKEKYNYHNINFIDLDTDDAGGFGWGFALPEEHIKSIVTHEQFDSIKYVLGGKE